MRDRAISKYDGNYMTRADHEPRRLGCREDREFEADDFDDLVAQVNYETSLLEGFGKVMERVVKIHAEELKKGDE